MHPIPLYPTDMPSELLHLQAMGCNFTVRCMASPDIGQALVTAFGGLQVSAPDLGQTSIHYTVRQDHTGIRLETNSIPQQADDLGDLLYVLDKSITLALQGARKDLCFVHGGAVVTPEGRVAVLTAASGSGKSTATWALLHHGFGYLSDELAPIDPGSLQVFSYPHALCLKRRPPAPYPLPAETLVTTRSLHVPVTGSPAPARLAAIFFVDHRYPENQPIVTELSPARAAMHLYANTLNPLAHHNDGLDAVVGITQNVPSYNLNTTNLSAACEALHAMFELRD